MSDTKDIKPKKRILTGDRTTGRLHLGHYVGSLSNRVALANEYETFILLADVQALTTHFSHPEVIENAIFQVAIDNLSVGLDPKNVTFVQQSLIKSIAELTIYYSMLITVNVLRHNPTIKTEAANYGYEDITYGFLGYPVSQAADITFCGADLVPVGEDQIPHMEVARRLVRRFNELYGDTLVEPKELLSQTPRLVGLDGGSKMGKSLGNALYLSDDEKTVSEKIRQGVTDESRIKVSDPGHPDICTINAYHKAFNAADHGNICEMCRTAQVGCVACKKTLASKINSLLAPMREKRAYYEAHTDEVRDIILSGSAKANAIGDETVDRVRAAMHVKLQ
jgi:tryptophanyl-tRNA synthetase